MRAGNSLIEQTSIPYILQGKVLKCKILNIKNDPFINSIYNFYISRIKLPYTYIGITQ